MTEYIVIYTIFNRETGSIVIGHHEIGLEIPDNRLPQAYAKSVLLRGMGLQSDIIIHDIYEFSE